MGFIFIITNNCLIFTIAHSGEGSGGERGIEELDACVVQLGFWLGEGRRGFQRGAVINVNVLFQTNGAAGL